MKAALAGQPELDFPEPANIRAARGDEDSDSTRRNRDRDDRDRDDRDRDDHGRDRDDDDRDRDDDDRRHEKPEEERTEEPPDPGSEEPDPPADEPEQTQQPEEPGDEPTADPLPEPDGEDTGDPGGEDGSPGIGLPESQSAGQAQSAWSFTPASSRADGNTLDAVAASVRAGVKYLDDRFQIVNDDRVRALEVPLSLFVGLET